MLKIKIPENRATSCANTFREQSFFNGSGGRLFVNAGRQFFLVPPWHAQKNSGPPWPTQKILVPPRERTTPYINNNSSPPLCDPQKILVPPFDLLKKNGPPFDYPKQFCPSQTDAPPAGKK